MKKSYSGLALHTKKTVFRKAVALCVFLFFCSISVSAKVVALMDNSFAEATPALIVVSDSASVYNIQAFANAEIIIKKDDFISQKAEIFVSEGVVLYNREVISNAEIVVESQSSEKLVSTNRKTNSIQKPAVTIAKKHTKQNYTFISSYKDSSVFSYHTKEACVFIHINELLHSKQNHLVLILLLFFLLPHRERKSPTKVLISLFPISLGNIQ